MVYKKCAVYRSGTDIETKASKLASYEKTLKRHPALLLTHNPSPLWSSGGNHWLRRSSSGTGRRCSLRFPSAPTHQPCGGKTCCFHQRFQCEKYNFHWLLWAWRPTSKQSEDHKLYLLYWVVLWANSCPDWLDFDDSYEALDRFYCLLLYCGSLSTWFVWSQILTERASCMLAFQKKLYRKKQQHISPKSIGLNLWACKNTGTTRRFNLGGFATCGWTKSNGAAVLKKA